MTITACASGRYLGSLPAGRGLRWLWLVALAFVAQRLLVHLAEPYLGSSLLGPFLIGTHVMLVPFLVANRRQLGVTIVAAGLLLNLIVMTANGGLMPVSPHTIEQVERHEASSLAINEHVPGTKNVLLPEWQTRLAVLSDTILVDAPKPLRQAVSIGDLLIAAGVAAIAVQLASAWFAERPQPPGNDRSRAPRVAVSRRTRALASTVHEPLPLPNRRLGLTDPER